MKTKLQHFAGGGVFAAFLMCLPLQGADTKLSDWKLGSVQVGEKVSMSDLEGQVVVFEYWGTR